MKRFFKKVYAWLSDRSAPSRGWRLLMLWLALAGTACLALWAIEEASQTAGMAAWVDLKAGTPQHVPDDMDVYHRVVQAGHWGNHTIGLLNPISYSAYNRYFDDACPQYEQAMRRAAEAKPTKGGFSPPAPKAVDPQRQQKRDEVITLELALERETEKSWGVKAPDGKLAFLPKSQVTRDGGTFKVPMWLVKMKKLSESK